LRNHSSYIFMRYFLTLITSGLTAASVFGQPGPPVMLARLNGPIVLDGLVNEPAWESVEPFEVLVGYPNFGAQPSEKTEIRVAYDDYYIYASCRFYAKDMSTVRATSLERDNIHFSDEAFAIVLDTFNDNENALVFWTNAAGTRIDLTIAGDAQSSGGPPWKSSWNTFWDVATTRSDEGWFAEMRIPFSSLRFQDDSGRVTMGLITWRWMPVHNENVTYPPVDPKWNWGIVKPSIAQDVILEGVYASRPLYVTPYVLGGIRNEQVELADGSGYELREDPQRNVGLDLKYGLTSNLTLDLTLNTDFAQVESDDEQINLTRFSLFFPEKRLFFQERASIFEFSNGGPTRLFHSRRIGLSDYGSVPIIAGARLVGRIGDWDLGALDMQTAKANFRDGDSTVTVPAENFGVVRLRRQVFNENSYLGGMATHRVNSEGHTNLAIGTDWTLRLWGDNYLQGAWSQTFDDEQGAVSSPLDNGRLRANFQSRSTVGPLYDISYARGGPDYNPAMGFESRSDFNRIGNSIGYRWLAKEASTLYKYDINFDFSIFRRNADNSIESAEMGPSANIEFKKGGWAGVWAKFLEENLTDSLELPEETHIPPGNYKFADFGGYYQMPFSRQNRLGVNISFGTFYDGHWLTAGTGPSWTISEHLRLSGQYQFTTASFPDRQQKFTVHLVQLRLNANLNTKLSTRSFVQLNTAGNLIGINFRLRYNAREGNDFYLVYNEGLTTDRSGNPRLPLSNNRTVLLKYARTFLP